MSKIFEALERAGIDIGERERLSLPEKLARSPEHLRVDLFEHTIELVNLYFTIDALKDDDEPTVLQFLASTHGEGTSTLSRGFARVVAAEQNHSVLLVDCDPAAEPPFPTDRSVISLIDAFKSDLPLSAAIHTFPKMRRLNWARLSSTPHPLLELEHRNFVRLIELVREEAVATILDSLAVVSAPDSAALSRYCDGTVLVVQAEKVRAPVVEATKNTVERLGGNILGVVLNRRRKYIPNWLYRRI